MKEIKNWLADAVESGCRDLFGDYDGGSLEAVAERASAYCDESVTPEDVRRILESADIGIVDGCVGKRALEAIVYHNALESVG